MVELESGMKVAVETKDGQKRGVISRVNAKTVLVKLDGDGHYIVRHHNQIVWSA